MTQTVMTGEPTRSADAGAGAGHDADPDKVMAFVNRAIEEVGATLNAGLVVLGDRLGYYRAMAAHGPVDAAALAAATSTAEPYVREWLNGQAAGGFVDYDPATRTYTLPVEHAIALTDESSPAFLPGFFQLALGILHDTDAVVEAARHGGGVGWHQHCSDVFLGVERFFRPGYQANLVADWLPAVGAVDRLEQGALVADLGCGHGSSTILLAQAFPRCTVIGYDYHPESIAIASERADRAGVGERVRFEQASAQAFPGTGFDLITTFDALHDMGDPVGAARHVRAALADDGIWMVVEPMAGDRPEDNFTPVGRVYYGGSTLLCTPASLAQDVGLGLGNQLGANRLREITVAGGFSRFRVAAETPFNLILDVRP
ncbi:class I SAM-dependent methyltransferase [Microlunatus aurantiacus]|uniref:Class I SAM-dependent methyltransferase n=1 Tax=Microlunatus aurantiacus TaxID=446786 RepID=A0ABP7DP57_9ACTN